MALSLSVIGIVLVVLTTITYLSYLGRKNQTPKNITVIEAVDPRTTEKYWTQYLGGGAKVCTDVVSGPLHPDLMRHMQVLESELLGTYRSGPYLTEIWKVKIEDQVGILKINYREHSDKTLAIVHLTEHLNRYISSIEVAVGIRDNVCNTEIHKMIRTAMNSHPVERIPASRVITKWVFQNGMFMAQNEQFKLLPDKVRLAIFQTVNILGKPKVTPLEFMSAVVNDLMAKKSVIITGKPGTGKTTFATWLLKTLLMHEDMPKVSFLAPSALAEISRGNFSINLSGIVLIDSVDINSELARFIIENTQTIGNDLTFVLLSNGYSADVTSMQKEALERIGRSNSYQLLPLSGSDTPAVIASLKGLGYREKSPVPVGKPLTIAEIFGYMEKQDESGNEQNGADLVLS